MRKEYSLKRNEEIGNIVRLSKRVMNDSFIIYYNKNDQDHSRVCISVNKKLGKAVIRNKIKRQTRAIITDILDFSLSIDYVVVIRNRFTTLEYKDNKDNFYKLCLKLKSNKE